LPLDYLQGFRGGKTYHVVESHPAFGVLHHVVHLVFLVYLTLQDRPLQDKHQCLGNGDLPIFYHVVFATLALDAHAPAPAMARRVLDDSAGGQDTSVLVVDGGKGDSNSSGHGYCWLGLFCSWFDKVITQVTNVCLGRRCKMQDAIEGKGGQDASWCNHFST
jgi:hypothetical protein